MIIELQTSSSVTAELLGTNLFDVITGDTVTVGDNDTDRLLPTMVTKSMTWRERP